MCGMCGMCGMWRAVYGMWHWRVAFGAWYVVCGVWCVACSVWRGEALHWGSSIALNSLFLVPYVVVGNALMPTNEPNPMPTNELNPMPSMQYVENNAISRA